MRTCWIIFGLGVLALFIDSQRYEHMLAWTLAKAEAAPTGTEQQFVADGVFDTTDASVVPRGLATHGSWVKADAFQGSHTTDWFRARRHCVILLCGYPALAPNSLTLT